MEHAGIYRGAAAGAVVQKWARLPTLRGSQPN
jgi:hypothetical protein